MGDRPFQEKCGCGKTSRICLDHAIVGTTMATFVLIYKWMSDDVLSNSSSVKHFLCFDVSILYQAKIFNFWSSSWRKIYYKLHNQIKCTVTTYFIVNSMKVNLIVDVEAFKKKDQS